MTQTKTVKIGKVPFDCLDYHDATKRIIEDAKSKKGGVVVTPNVAHVLQVEKDQKYLNLINEADYVLPDGQPIIWASKALNKPLPAKISGSDLILDLCREAAGHDVSVFLLGGLEGEADKAAANLCKKYPGLKVAGTYYPEFGFEKDEAECQRIVDAINASGASIVFIGVGCPKQEYWAQKYRSQLPGKVLLGIGISIAFCAGTVGRAPKWMQKSGLEWFFRFLQEPKRLGMRYLRCFLFPYIVAKNLA